MAERVKCDLAASTGVHDASSLIKQLLAGANAVQVVSALYKSGPGAIQNMLKGLMMWMEDQEFKSIDDFRGKMSQSRSKNPAVYERAQFMQHFSGKF
jgi:dihydroorotate dehydrogenase (fumarate)